MNKTANCPVLPLSFASCNRLKRQILVFEMIQIDSMTDCLIKAACHSHPGLSRVHVVQSLDFCLVIYIYLFIFSVIVSFFHLQSLKVPIMNIINNTVEVKVNETVLSLSTDINEIKSNVQLLEQEVKDQREISLQSLNEVKNDSNNYCDSELQSLKVMIESNTKELNTELVAMKVKEGISELNEKLDETLISLRRDITDQISDIQRQLNGQFKTEMNITSENYKRPLIDCGNLDEGQSSGIYKIFPEDSLDGFYVYCDMETDNGGWTVSQL